MKKIMLIGNKLHGKTTLARFLRDELASAQCYSTSDFLIYRLAQMDGTDIETILADKEKYRPQLVKLGNSLCDVDPGCLVSICLWSCHSDFAIIDGIRRVSEYDKVRSWFDRIYWIDRPGIEKGLDNLELESRHADEIVKNHGNLEDLKRSAAKIARQLLKK